ncbi:hypothetical protein BOTBODRAFT_129640, partial [Botryobasidium botryosum FD-172 SS1]
MSQGVAPIDFENAPGKRHEFDPIPTGVVTNLGPHGHHDSRAASELPGGGDDAGDGDPNLEASRAQLEEQARKYLAAQSHEVIIPSYSAWFDISKINQIEQRALPEFFNSRNRSKTPATYKDYRDFMIHTYRLRPSEYLTVTACRRNLAGDVCAILRVHAFLEQWGLINYQVDPDTRPAALGPPFTGHFRVIVDTPRGLQPLHPGSSSSRPSGLSHSAAAPSGAPKPPSLELRQSIYQTSMKTSQPLSPSAASQLISQAGPTSKDQFAVTYACDTCGVDCTPVRYHSLKSKNYELCPSCYLDGRFSSKMFSGDFVKLTSASVFKHGEGAAGADDWSDAETLLLLEGIEMYDDDWALISEHVGTRSREQCIAHFLQLPIEDEYISAPSEGELGPLQYARLPFDRTDNPVMSVVAFLASAVGPGVAAAAAQSALSEMTDRMKGKLKKGESGSEQNQKAAAAEGGSREGAENGEGPAAGEGEGSKSTPKDDAAADVKGQEDMDVDRGTSGARDEAGAKASSNINRVAGIALGAAAAKAQVLASHEEATIRALTTQVVRAQLTKLELKMTQFDAMESLLEEERKSLEAARQQLLKERTTVMKGLESVRELMGKAAAGGGSSASPLGGPVGMHAQMAGIANGVGAPMTRASPVDLMLEGGEPPEGEGIMIAPLS